MTASSATNGFLSDAALFQTIASGDARPARAAKAALYQRHIRYLFGVLHRQQDKLLNLAGLSAEDLVQDTFERAFDRAQQFKAADGLDEERSRRRTRAWLGRIATNLVADSFRRFREVSASPHLEQLPQREEEQAPPSKPEVRQLRAALETLSERERDILRVTALYHKAGKYQRLPNDVSAELAARWGINNDNVRAIRSRATKKLRRAMERQATGQSS